jgi:hypothetical protein
MKLKGILILLTAAMLYSCGSNNSSQKKAPLKDSLTYSYHTVREHATDCGNNPDSTCANAQFVYPIFKGRQTLNDSVKGTLVNFFNSEKHPDTSLRDCAQLFLKAYYNTKKANPQINPFKLNCVTRVIKQDSSLITIDASIFLYYGNGTGHVITRFINWDTKASKKLLLSDLLTDGSADKVSKIAEGIFRKNENLSDTASLQPTYTFKGNKFFLTDDFLITPDGLGFFYNQYQVKQTGPVRILVPYSDIKSLVKPNTILAQYLKQ